MLITYRIRFEKDGVTIAQQIGSSKNDLLGGDGQDPLGGDGQDPLGGDGQDPLGGDGQDQLGGDGQDGIGGGSGGGRLVAVILGPTVIGNVGSAFKGEAIPAKPVVVDVPKNSPKK